MAANSNIYPSLVHSTPLPPASQQREETVSLRLLRSVAAVSNRPQHAASTVVWLPERRSETPPHFDPAS